MQDSHQAPVQNQSASSLQKAAPVAIVALIVIAGLALVMTQSSPAGTTQNTTATTLPSSSAAPTSMQQITDVSFKNGEYTATGTYLTPGGQKEVELTVILEDNIVTNSAFVGKATDPASQRFQKEFGDNYSALVVGKNISEVKLSKVSGSSLTSGGFNEALAKIKLAAQS